jgi:glycosyltransferase involved in cell wall biosynthesis
VRVVVVSAWEPWRDGDGAALILRHQLPIWAQRHDVVLLAAGAPAASPVVPEAVEAMLPGVAVKWFGTSCGPVADQLGRRGWSLRHREPAHVRYVERPDLLAALDAAIATADVLHLHGWGTARLWRHAGGRPTVHVAVDPWSVNVANRRRTMVRRLVEVEQRPAIRRHEARHYPRLDAVVVVAEPDVASIARLAPAARIVVVPNGVAAGPPPVPMPDRPVIGFHGAYESQANVDAATALVRQVLPGVRRELPAVRALLVGRQPPRQVRGLAADGVVEVNADVADLRAALDAMSVHVDWMTSGTGLKNKVLEAMAAGRPVVASRLGAAGIGAGPGVVVADTIDGAVAEAVRLLRDSRSAAATGEAGRQRVITDFGWPANAARIEQLWHDVAAAKGRR